MANMATHPEERKNTRFLNFDGLFAGAASEFLAAFERSTDQVRPDETGTPREEQVRQFLTEWLPERYGVTHGYAINLLRKASDQIDCAIIDALECPKFFQDRSSNR